MPERKNSSPVELSQTLPHAASGGMLAEDQLLLAQDDFWENNKSKILAGIAIVFVCAAAIAFYLLWDSNRRSQASEALATAHSPEQLQAVWERWPATPAGLNAGLLLAASLREQGKVAESNAIYEAILTKADKNFPLLPEAALGLAQNAMVALQPDSPATASAMQTLREAAARFPRSAAAAMALLTEAQLAEAVGQTENAMRIYRDVMADFPQSLPAQVASQELQRLAERQQALAQPSPTPDAPATSPSDEPPAAPSSETPSPSPGQN